LVLLFTDDDDAIVTAKIQEESGIEWHSLLAKLPSSRLVQSQLRHAPRLGAILVAALAARVRHVGQVLIARHRAAAERTILDDAPQRLAFDTFERAT
jgi:hypothetical protein